MKAVEKAIWYIENHYREQISLDALAGIAGVSRYHLSRIFCYAVGQPISRYLRLRRLSSAAIALAAGEADILGLALSLGYGSHEAFSRAFKDHFGRTPDQVRKQGHTNNLALMEAKLMQTSQTVALTPPRVENGEAMSITGLSRHYHFSDVGGIPDQWQSFAPLIPTVAAEPQPVTYGVIYNGGDEGFDYLSGVCRSPDKPVSDRLVRLELTAQRYLVFEHAGHVASVRDTCGAIWSDWLPDSEYSVTEAPWFERYGECFDPQTGAGGLEIWIPVQAAVG